MSQKIRSRSSRTTVTMIVAALSLLSGIGAFLPVTGMIRATLVLVSGIGLAVALGRLSTQSPRPAYTASASAGSNCDLVLRDRVPVALPYGENNVEIVSGSVWITSSGRDLILLEGESRSIPHSRLRTFVMRVGPGPATIRLRPDKKSSSRASPADQRPATEV